MTCVLIVCYYGLSEGIACVADALRARGARVEHFPLFQLFRDQHSRIDAYAAAFAERAAEVRPDVVLWWYYAPPVATLRWMRDSARGAVHVLYNWDDPHKWVVDGGGDEEAMDLGEKAGLFDVAINTCSGTLERYRARGVRVARTLYPGFDVDVHHPGPDPDDEAFRCDVSACVTNLYEDDARYPGQLVPRKRLLDLLAAAPDFDFRVYGPAHLAERYPRHYRGLVRYEDTRKVFRNSALNVCTHVVGTVDGYLNERVATVLGSGGVLLVDAVPGIERVLVDGRDCVYIDASDPVGQVRRLLAGDRAALRRVADAGRALAIARFQWHTWVDGFLRAVSDFRALPDRRTDLCQAVSPPTAAPAVDRPRSERDPVEEELRALLRALRDRRGDDVKTLVRMHDLCASSEALGRRFAEVLDDVALDVRTGSQPA